MPIPAAQAQCWRASAGNSLVVSKAAYSGSGEKECESVSTPFAGSVSAYIPLGFHGYLGRKKGAPHKAMLEARFGVELSGVPGLLAEFYPYWSWHMCWRMGT